MFFIILIGKTGSETVEIIKRYHNLICHADDAMCAARKAGKSRCIKG